MQVIGRVVPQKLVQTEREHIQIYWHLHMNSSAHSMPCVMWTSDIRSHTEVRIVTNWTHESRAVKH